MYQLYEISRTNGAFILHHESRHLDDCVHQREELGKKSPQSIIIFKNSDNISSKEMEQILTVLFSINKGVLERVTRGAKIKAIEDTVCCGEGTSCFCVVTPTEKYCETFYCDEHGYCWAVRCEMGCGC